jgi:hypothetical protein
VSKYKDGKTKKNQLVILSLPELNALIDSADKALDGDSNDAEHDALYSIREHLADMSSDPQRRREGTLTGGKV